MIRKFKTLGLAMVALLAMCAVVASAASAQFTANSYPTTTTATSPIGNDIFTIDGTSVECDAHFVGTQGAASNTITITPSYTNCKAFGFTGTINMNGCTYTLHDTGANAAGKVTINCPTGKFIIIVGSNCEVQVGAQGPLGSLLYTNVHPNFTVRANVSGITANKTKDGFLCPLSGKGHSPATYVQDAAVTVKPVAGGNTISVD